MTSLSLRVPGSSLLSDRLTGEGDTATRSTGALTCLWHLPKRINQSHSAAAVEESPPCTLPGSGDFTQRGHCLGNLSMPNVFIICLLVSDKCLGELVGSHGNGAVSDGLMRAERSLGNCCIVERRDTSSARPRLC